MAHVITNSISETECIGDSLNTKINPNFLNLDNSVQSLSTNKNIFTGNVGIGTSSPTRPLEIVKNNGASIGIADTSTGGNALVLEPARNSNGFAQIDVSGANALRLNTNNTERLRIDSSGNVGIGTSLPKSNLTINGSFATSAPIVVTTPSYTVPASATSLIHNANAGTYTLPSPSACPGQWLYIKTVSAVNISSASTNVEPLSSLVPRNTILPQNGAAAQGKWVNLQSDGTDWVAMAGN